MTSSSNVKTSFELVRGGDYGAVVALLLADFTNDRYSDSICHVGEVP